MGGLPKKALKKSQLVLQTAGSAVNDGSHQVFRATFVENGKSVDGFYKELAPTKDYPELLAKMSVATSVFKRLFQGKRSAEERLVFDDNDKIVGTLSINLEGFKPFNFASETVPTDPAAKELVIPSTKTLIEHNVMESILSSWFLGNDDNHPHNNSLAGDIDLDMFWYSFTIYIKSPRAVIGIPNTQVNLTVADWDRFPNVRDSKPYHWPTYKHPGQETIPSVMPVQGQILTKVLPKTYADPVQFENLAREPLAQEQKLAAALKALLTFQPDIARRRLAEHFGDMALNYTSLDETDTNLRIKYETLFPHFCNQKTNIAPFIDFMMEMYQEYYDNLYRVVVFYMGCENNGYGLPLPATCHALYRKPSLYRNIESWVKTQNETTHLKDDSLLKYDMPELQKRYHQVWRDAFAPTLKELLHGSYNLTNKVLLQVSPDAVVLELVGKKVSDSSFTKAWELFGTMPELSKDKVEPLIYVDKDSGLRDALLFLIEFTSKLNSTAKAYYEKERKDLKENDNLTFSSQLNQLYNDYNLKIRQKLAHTSSHALEFNRIAVTLEQFTKQVNFQLHLTTTDVQMKDTPLATLNKEIVPHTNEEVINQFNVSLFLWAKGLSAEKFNQYIIEIIDKYYVPTYLSSISSRYREKPVKDYLIASINDSCENRLAYILSSGAESAGALNTLLIQHLSRHVVETQHLPSVLQAQRDGSFYTSSNLDVYTRSAVAFATHDKSFVHLYNEQGTKLFYQSMYDWVDKLSENKFNGLITVALNEYENGLSITSRLWGASSRRSEVRGYYQFSSHAKILAMIFLNGKDSSTLNECLFKKVIEAMKDDLAKNPEKQQHPGNKLIMQYNHTDNKSFYFKVLRAHAEEPSHLQELKPSKTLLLLN